MTVAKKSEEIFDKAERYGELVRVTDKLGRVIGVRRLTLSQQLRVEEMAPALEGDRMITDKDGNSVSIPRRAPLALAASVREIDGIPIIFPRRREELDAILDRLDEEGTAAVVEAMAKLFEPSKIADQEQIDPVKQAKNSPRTL